jgi:MFS family permease
MSSMQEQTSTMESGEAAPRPAPLWRNRDFILLIGGQGVSSLGSQVSLIAFPLLMLALTHSPAQAGLMSAVRGLPFVLFSLPAGALVDRWNRKRVMILCDLGRALALGSIPVAFVFGDLTFVQLYLVALIEGTLFTFFSVAEIASIPHVVAKEQITAATGQDRVAYSLANLLGPALAPILYGLGQVIPFLTDAVSYFVSVLSLFLIKTKFHSERINTSRNLWREIHEGLSWLWHNKPLRFIAILTFGLNTPCTGYVLIIIVLAQHMHAPNTLLGLIFAGGGVGSIIGAMLVNPLQRRFGFSRVFITAVWVWCLSWLFFAFAPDPLLLGAVTTLSFIVVPVYSVMQYSYRLTMTPDHLLGRVNSVYRLLAFGAQPLGIALTGVLLQAIGPAPTVLALFIPQGILAVAATINQELRHIRSIA